MNLTQEQIIAVGEWVSQNASISDVQKKLSDTFGINMTYMDVRFLIDDIGAQLQDLLQQRVFKMARNYRQNS